MKRARFLCVLLCLTLLLSLHVPAALANEWGLKSGVLLDVVSKSGLYDEYTALAQINVDGGQVAVMASRYHSVLLFAYKTADNEIMLNAYHTAVKQPDEKGYKKVTLKRKDPGFTLSYKDAEFTFVPLSDDDLLTYTLENGKIGELTLAAGGTGSEVTGWLTCSDGSTDINWYVGKYATPSLEEFNLLLFPRTIGEIGALREMRNVVWPQFESYEMSEGVDIFASEKTGTIPVYSAPSENSKRFAKGKASVNLYGGGAKLYGLSEDGNWALIEYEVSDRTSRFGYVRISDLPQDIDLSYVTDIPHMNVTVTVTQDTFLTDDPNVSQYKQKTLSAGDSVQLLALYGNWYAYVETTLDGQTVRGFVPAAALSYPLPTEEAADIEEQLIGNWVIDGGGEMLGYYISLDAEGTATTSDLPIGEYEMLSQEEQEEYLAPYAYSYCICKATEREHAWSSDDYILIFRDQTGHVASLFGFSLYQEDSFGISYWEGGAGFIRDNGYTDDEGVNG